MGTNDEGDDYEIVAAYFWNSTEYDSEEAWLMMLFNIADNAYWGHDSKDEVFSVCCLKN